MEMTLIQAVQLMGEINTNPDYSAYISNGHMVIESNIIKFGESNNGKTN